MLYPVDNCCGCGACVAICPTHCIKMCENEEGFLYPRVERGDCLECHLCERVCPEMKDKSCETMKKTVEAYAAVCNEEKIRKNSSSGGVFYPVAREILKQGGIVFGAVMASDGMRTYHLGVETEEELKKLMGAKYVQSTMGDIYAQIRKNLQQERKVLFSGTPCQVEALYSYLGDDKTDKLFTIDFICHGVPSPGVWKKYLSESMGDASFVSFRDKTEGWKKFSLKVIDKNGRHFRQRENQNPYMRGFLNHLYCRQSCHNCRYKGIERNSNLTLGDFWQVEKFLTDMDDDRGTSLVFVQNDKGKELISSVVNKQEIKMVRVDTMKAALSNPMMLESIVVNKKRTLFFKMMESNSVCESVEICLKRGVVERIIGKIKWILFHK